MLVKPSVSNGMLNNGYINYVMYIVVTMVVVSNSGHKRNTFGKI